MLSFRSMGEVRNAHLFPRLKNVLFNCIKALIEAYGDDFDPDDNYVVLYTRDTTDEDALSLFGTTWQNACLEGVSLDKESNSFLTCVLFNNDSGVTIVIPDAPWLAPAFRAKLLNELIESP